MTGDPAIGTGLLQHRHFGPASLRRERAAGAEAAHGRLRGVRRWRNANAPHKLGLTADISASDPCKD